MNWRRWHDDFNQSGRHVINETGDKPLTRQCGNRSERSNVDGNRRARIGDYFCSKFGFLYLKIARQSVGVAGKTSNAAIGMLKYDDVKISAASRNLSSNLTDSPK